MLSFISLKKPVVLAPVLALTLGLASCGGPPTQKGGTPGGESPTPSGKAVSLTGAGATFPAPLYQRWFAEYNKVNPNVQVSYQSIGSGAGVEQFLKGTVDFGASDVAMKDDEIARVSRGVVLLPMTAGAIVFAYNLPDVKELKLSQQTQADIFLGKITKWNDPAIAKENPGIKLPDEKITVVHRSDGSGTTGVFTKYLSAISPPWKAKVGDGKTVEWPTGIGAKGNEGVTAQILQTQGAIGYIEYGYAKEQNIPMASLQNKSGNFVAPSSQTAANTLKAVQLPENLRAFINNPEGADAYPLVTYTWILAYKQYPDAEKAKALKEVLDWAINSGQPMVEELGYVPLPDSVKEKVKAAINTIR